MSARVFHGLDAPTVVISPGECLAAVQPLATLACACNLPGFCKSSGSPQWGSCRECTVLGGFSLVASVPAESGLIPASPCPAAGSYVYNMSMSLAGASQTGSPLPSTSAPWPPQPSQGWLRPWPLPLRGTAVHEQLHCVSPAGCTALINDPIPESRDGTAP